MNNQESSEELTCTRCKEVQEFHCKIVYSQGDKVCLDCKKQTQASDNFAFDRFQNSRGIY
jgi:hypothetical protein